jgi:enoyl-CoA hydratase/carnithine racemase
MLLTGEPLQAARAYALGLVNRVVEPGEALAAALELATAISAGAPVAVRTAKQIANESAEWPIREAFERQRPLIQAVRDSEDASEGARAFVEKRAPVWRGR